MRETIAIAKKAGIKDEKIILDPGVGFGKTYEQNLMAIHYMDDMKALGYPILLGTKPEKTSIIFWKCIARAQFI